MLEILAACFMTTQTAILVLILLIAMHAQKQHLRHLGTADIQANLNLTD